MKRIVFLSASLFFAMSADAAQVVFEGCLIDAQTRAPRPNVTLTATPKFFASTNSTVSLGALDEVQFQTDERGNFSFYSGEWDNPDGIDEIWLGAEVNGHEIVPRKRIGSAPYAIHAKTAQTVSNEGRMKVESLNLAESAEGCVSTLTVNERLTLGTNNIATVNSFDGFYNITVPELQLSPWRCFSGMSRFVLKNNYYASRSFIYLDSQDDLFEERLNGSLFAGKNAGKDYAITGFDTIDYEFINSPSDGLVTIQFKFATDIGHVMESLNYTAQISLWMERLGMRGSDRRYLLGSSEFIGITFTAPEFNSLFLTIPVIEGYNIEGRINFGAIWKRAGKQGHGGTVSIASVFHPFFKYER